MNINVGDIVSTRTNKYEHAKEDYGYVIKEDENYFYIYWFEDYGYDKMIFRYAKKYDNGTFIKVS